MRRGHSRGWIACVLVCVLAHCAPGAESVRAEPPTVLDEIAAHVPSARRWFGMVSDLTFVSTDGDAIAPRFASIRSPLVLRQDGAGQALVPELPTRADGLHRIALSTDGSVWVRTREMGAGDVRAEVVRGVVLYRNAVAGGDLLYKLTPTHVDEYLYLRLPPAHLERRVGIERGPGVSEIREAGAGLEVVDRAGVARLRMSPPIARSADGARRRGAVRLEGDEVVLEIELAGLTAPVLVDPDWATTGTMSVGHWADASFRMSDGAVMVVAGCALSGCPQSFAQSACGQVLADTEIWTESSGTWSAARPLNTARFSFGASMLSGGDFLVAGGCTSTNCSQTTDSAERYQSATRTWGDAGRLSSPRANSMVAALHDGSVLVAGGCDAANCTTDVDRYDSSANTWSALAPLTTPRGFGTATTLADGRVLVAGGCSDGPCATLLGDATVFDPTSNQWHAAGTMSTSRAGHTATLLGDGSVLVAGGCADAACMMTIPTAEIWSADTSSGGSFRSTATMPGARHNHTATALATGEVLFAGGASGAITSLPTAMVFVPNSERWVPIQAMQLDRAYHVAVLLDSGNVLVAGGCNTETCMPWAEVYSPANLPEEIGPSDGSLPQDAVSEVVAMPDVLIAPASPHPMAYRSGARRCATDTVQELACPLATHPLQDADFQPDERGYVPNAPGEITDVATGLVWQAVDDGSAVDAVTAMAHCATFATESPPARSWRLPNVIELMTLVNYGRNLPSIDPQFAGTQPSNYWTSTPVGSGASQSWTVKFDFGEVVPFGNAHAAAVKCVRGNLSSSDGGVPGHLRQSGPLAADVLTTTSDVDGLEWQRQDDGVRRTWQDSLAYCATLSLAGKTGWHLPNVNELRGLVEYGGNAGGAVIDATFVQPRPDLYWTSTPNDGAPTLAWGISFNLGVVDGVTVSGLAYARCVRHVDASPAPTPGPVARGGCGCRVGGAANVQSSRLRDLVVGVVMAMLSRARRRARRRQHRSR